MFGVTIFWIEISNIWIGTIRLSIHACHLKCKLRISLSLPMLRLNIKFISKRLCLWSVSMSELKMENHLKTTESKSVPMLRQYIKWSENDWVSDLVQLLWDNIFAKNDWVSDFSRHSGFQSKMLKKRQSLRFGSITMG